MADRDLIGKILDAQYEADHCAPNEQADRVKVYYLLLDQALEGTAFSRLMLVEALKDRYKEYRRARRSVDGIPSKVENQLFKEIDLPSSTPQGQT